MDTRIWYPLYNRIRRIMKNTLSVLKSFKELYFTNWIDMPLGLFSLPFIILVVVDAIITDIPWWIWIIILIVLIDGFGL